MWGRSAQGRDVSKCSPVILTTLRRICSTAPGLQTGSSWLRAAPTGYTFQLIRTTLLITNWLFQKCLCVGNSKQKNCLQVTRTSRQCQWRRFPQHWANHSQCRFWQANLSRRVRALKFSCISWILGAFKLCDDIIVIMSLSVFKEVSKFK